MAKEYKLLVRNGEINKHAQKQVQNWKKREFKTFVLKFCDNVGYKFISEQDYADKFYSKFKFVEDFKNKKLDKKFSVDEEKKLLFMILCEHGILFERDFDIYSGKKFEHYKENELYDDKNLVKGSQIIYDTADEIIDKFEIKGDRRIKFEEYIEFIRSQKGCCRKINAINKKYEQNHEIPLNKTEMSEFIKYWQEKVWQNKKPAKYERIITQAHYNLLVDAKRKLSELESYWEEAICWKKSRKRKTSKNKIFIDKLSSDECSRFLKEYIVPIVGEFDVDMLLNRLYNNVDNHRETLIYIYNTICQEKNISEKAIAKRLIIWCCICDFFSDDDNKLNDINIYESQDTYEICKELSLLDSMPKIDFYSQFNKYDSNQLALNIPTVKLGYKIINNIGSCLQAKVNESAIINPQFGGTTILKDYKAMYEKEYKDLVSKVKSFNKTISSYDKTCNKQFCSRDELSHFVKSNQFYRIKDFIDVSDKEIWKSVKLVYGVSEEKISARIEANSESLKIMIYESAINDSMKVIVEEIIYNKLLQVFKREC